MGFGDEGFEEARDAMSENIYNGNDRSNSQFYKQTGDSTVIDVLQYIMENLCDAMPHLFDDTSVGSFFSGIGALGKALTCLENHHNESGGDAVSVELMQIGYINDYSGDANRIYDGNAVARVLKTKADGGVRRLDGTASMLTRCNWKNVT